MRGPVNSNRKARIMVVDDSSEDGFLITRALDRQDPAPEVEVFRSGPEALERLRQSPRPDLVLLDLNMPGMDGKEVLSHIRDDPALTKLPVAILTTSNHEKDVEMCYGLRANTYLQKPGGYKDLVALMDVVHDHWFRRSILPA